MDIQKKENSVNESLQEQRIRSLTHIYYSRQDIIKSLFSFSKDREVVPKYYEGFGRRPDIFQYESDIIELVKKGATSFHCSQELWSNPLDIITRMSRAELDNLRKGWDFVVDIDSQYFDYSKICAQLILNALKFHGIKNFGIKFSGSKGIHLIIPSRAFPKDIHGAPTKDQFPEWPRIITQYIYNLIKPKLIEKITAFNYKNSYVKDFEESQKVMPDLILVAPRHLFRMPYSLHEKTALASVVLDEDELQEFQPSHAHPMKVKIKPFLSSAEDNEAAELLMQALDWHETYRIGNKKEQKAHNAKEFEPLTIKEYSEEDFPETIKEILKGMQDGKKRSLFILINFFRSLGLQREQLEKFLEEWNLKNKTQLKDGYIKSQVQWAFRNKLIPPPNFSNQIYKDLGVLHESDQRLARNPVQYVLKSYLIRQQKQQKPKKQQRIKKAKDNVYK
jgi:hypothetical protein